MELRDAFPKFRAHGIALYAISYDGVRALADFAERYDVPYALLSDVDSEVIRRFGILNTQIAPGDGPLYGIPYPGAYVVDEAGVVVAKFFHDSYKRRDSPENLIDAALGRVVLEIAAPVAAAADPELRLSVNLQGGNGSLRQGIVRKLVVRFELPEGLHVYGEPVPDGMVPTTVDVSAPEGIVVEPPRMPASTPLHLEDLDVTLPVFSGTVDVEIPIYATSVFVSECRPVERETATLEVTVRYQACDDRSCRLPRTEKLSFEISVEPVDVQKIGLHAGHGQRESSMDSAAHLRRLFLRKLRARPLGLPGFLLKQARLELAAWRRRRGA